MCWQRSYEHLESSAALFLASADAINSAFVTCNLGKLMRVGYAALLVDAGSFSTVLFQVISHHLNLGQKI